MKTLLILIALVVSCIGTAEAGPRSYQSIIDELRAENSAGDKKAVELQGKIDARETELLDAYKNLNTARDEKESAQAESKKWKKAGWTMFWRGVFATVLVGAVGVGLYLARRSSVVIVPQAQPSSTPDRSIPPKSKPRRRTKPAVKKTR